MATLITTEIPIIRELSDHGDVPVPHTGNAVYSVDVGGGRWIRKREGNLGVEEMLAEMIGWLIARKLGVPVPGGAVCLVEGERSWLSAQIPDVVHWDPSRGHLVTNLDGLGAMIALDVLIMNPDRHARNILLQAAPDDLHLRAWAIDHDHALVGWPEDFARQRGAVPASRNLAWGLPLDLLRDGAMETAEKATQLTQREILPMVTEACTIASEQEVQTISEVLAERCAGAEALVEEYLRQVRGR